MRIYFAGPLFCAAERAYNLRLVEKLEAQGFQVFLPQRDGVESEQPPYNEMNQAELQGAIFKLDRDEVLRADIFLIVLDGRVPDEGACLELGLAYGQVHLLQQDKLLIGLHTDLRAAYPGGVLNAMIAGALDRILGDENELLAELAAYRSTRTAIG